MNHVNSPKASASEERDPREDIAAGALSALRRTSIIPLTSPARQRSGDHAPPN
ncbi:hypothetical protein FHT70_000273 [Rhizobium sp. BK049]|nr:hypothetical protein [Rhizobium sp. BK049]